MNGAARGAGTADPGLAKLRQRPALSERALERAQLAIGAGRGLELDLDQVGTVTSKALELEHEPADVSELELAQPAEIPDASPHPRSLA
jgi:hypothetical protein